MLFWKKKTVGLDIGSNYLKLVQLDSSRSGYELILFEMLPIQSDIITEGLVSDKNKLTAAIQDLLKKAGLKKGDVVLGISGHASVIIKRITVPQMNEDELSLGIKYEAEQYIPFDINEVNIGFQILGPKPQEVGQMEIVLVAVKKNVINDYAEVVANSGLTPIIVDVDAFALGNMYEINYNVMEKRNVALVNVGASKTNISIIKDGLPVFTRDCGIGSNYQTEVLMKALNISKENAERVKRGQAVEGIAPENAQMHVSNSSDEIYAEIYRSFEYFRSSVSEEELNGIVLSGGAALTKSFSEMMTERLGVPVEVADPFKKIKISKKLDAALVKDLAPIAAVAVGLALRRAGDR
ncbi:MAG: pilus assembly protein PilM [Thermodesulfovibrio sp.]|nr:pilus assembly protein PilM [Thermodesulfovibrio sp.]